MAQILRTHLSSSHLSALEHVIDLEREGQRLFPFPCYFLYRQFYMFFSVGMRRYKSSELDLNII